MSKDSGIVNIHGKEYQTVALRVRNFREKHPNYRLVTSIHHRDDECVVMVASIADENGNIVATGHSEEYRHTSNINKTSALENSETSAIGRALASFGFGGTEFASADEVARAVSGQKGRITPVSGSLEALSPEDQQKAKATANQVVDLWGEGKEFAAYELVYDAGHGNEMILGIWEVLQPQSAIRNKLKKMKKENELQPQKAA